MNKLRTLLALVGVMAAAPAATAGTWDFTTPSGSAFRMYIPDTIPVVYGFLVTCNPSGGDNRPYADDARYQDLAQTFGFGVIGTQIANNDANTGYADDIIAALTGLAGVSGRAEVANAPVVIEGLSLGGFIAMQFAVQYPARTIAYMDSASRLVISGGAAGIEKTPGLFTLGDQDQTLQDALDRVTAVAALRTAGHPVAMWIQFGAGHEYKNAFKLGFQFFADVIKYRYPASTTPLDGPVALTEIPQDFGWLADPTTLQSGFTQIAAYADYAKAKTQGFWLPTSDVAFAFRGHATQDKHLAFTAENDSYMGFESAPMGTPYDMQVNVTGFAGVTKVSFFDGAKLISEDTTAPYTATWTPDTIGVHNIVAVAEDGSGGQATGLPLPVLVPGVGAPGGGDLAQRPDAGPVDGTADAGPGGGGGGADGGGGGCGCDAGQGGGGGASGGGGGCGCLAGGSAAGGNVLLLLGVAVLLVRRRR